MSFIEEIKTHLIAYKELNFKSYRHWLWRNDPDNVLKYTFIPEEADNNLIQTYKGRFLDYEINLPHRITRHMYFHHMNSSQAMCINFFYPLFVECKLELITDFLEKTGVSELNDEKIKYGTVAFEKRSMVDGGVGRRPTNFDFYFETVFGKKFFFEIKYTEADFGKAPKDRSDTNKFDLDHIKKFNNVYKNKLGRN